MKNNFIRIQDIQEEAILSDSEWKKISSQICNVTLKRLENNGKIYDIHFDLKGKIKKPNIMTLDKLANIVKMGFERVDTQIKQVNEKVDTQFKEINEKVDTQFKEINEKVDTQFKEINEKVDTQFKEVNARLDKIENRLDKIENCPTIKKELFK